METIARQQTRFHALRLRLELHVPTSRAGALAWEFLLFAVKQGWACVFGAVVLALELITARFWPAHAWLHRYDFLFLAGLAVQLSMLWFRLETVREAKVILMFHVIGTVMEVFKTRVGSWVYPESSLFHLGQVPLFSGFMYASVGSYLARITRILELRYRRYPRRLYTLVLASLIYANFFTHHYLPDLRVDLFIAVAVLFGPTWVYYRPSRVWRRMPLVLGFGLIAIFLWLAENLGTFANIWRYPHQRHSWSAVRPEKYGAWLLLIIVSFVLVTLAHPPDEALRTPAETEPKEKALAC